MLNVESVSKVVMEAIETACNPSSTLAPDSRLDDIGLDSLGLAAVIAAVEDEFGIHLPPDQLMEFLKVSTVGDVLQVIHGFESTNAAVAAQ